MDRLLRLTDVRRCLWWMKISQKGLAIVSMLIFVVMFSILASVLLSLVSSQTRLMEHYIRRIKGYYVAEAGAISAWDALRRKSSFSSSLPVEWVYDKGTGNPYGWHPATVTAQANMGINGTTLISSTADYTTNW
jgi:type II secretory pathway component PulK